MATISTTGSASAARQSLHVHWFSQTTPHGEFWLLALAVLLFNIGMAVFFFLYNLFMLDLGYTERPLGILAGALAFGSMAGTIPMGIAAQRQGTRKVLVACLLGVSMAFGARLFLLWYPAQVAFAFFDGVMLCGWAICLSPAVAAIVAEERRPAAFSILFAVAVAAGSLGGLIGGNMPDWCHTFAQHSKAVDLSGIVAKRDTLLFACLLTGLAAWPIICIGDPKPHSRPEPLAWMRKPSPFLQRYLFASVCWAAAIGAFNPFTNVFFVRYVGLATAHLGNFFAIAQLVQAAAVLLAPFLLRRTGLVSGIAVAQIASAIAVGLLAAGRGVLVEEGLYCAFMAAQHMCDPGLQSLLMDRIPEGQRSGASALNYLAISVAQAISAAISGAAIQRFGYPAILAVIAAAILTAAIVLRWLLGNNGREIPQNPC